MKGKYLITTDNWFIAPDGQQYRAVWGNVEVCEDSILGLKTNRMSTNWYLKIGTEKNHIIVAGCQIHYAAKSEERPSEKNVLDWAQDANGFREDMTRSRIYFTE